MSKVANGVLGDNARSYLRLNDANHFDTSQILQSKVNVAREGEEPQYEALGAIQDEGERKEGYMALEVMANTIYSMLNGTAKAGGSIKQVLSNSLNTGTFSTVVQPTVEVFMLDYIRPRLVVSNFLATTIPVGPNTSKNMIAMLRQFGLVKIEEVARDGDLPIVSPQLSEYTEQIAQATRRYGVKLEIENDLMEGDQFGVLGFLMTAIADGFRFRKELEVLKVINSTGEVLYDNMNPSNGVFGVHTAGRALDGSYNGTVTMEDFTRCFGYAMMRGTNPETILLHPFAVFNMIGDSDLRNIVAAVDANGVPPMPQDSVNWGHPFGEDFGLLLRHVGTADVTNPGNSPVPQFGNLGYGPLGVPGLDPYTNNQSSLNQYFTGRANIPGMNITIVTSPQVPIKSVSIGGQYKLVTNIYIIGDRKPVAILQEANPGILEWEDIEKEMSFMGFREKYAVVPLYQGRGIYTIKGAVIDKNYPIPERSWDVAGTVATAEPDSTAQVT